jgi:hypothetical protein
MLPPTVWAAAKGTFTPNGKPRVTVLKQFTLKR